MEKARRNLFLPLTLIYLTAPALIFLLTWIRPVIGMPVAALVFTGWLRLTAQREIFAARPALPRQTFWLVLALALGWTIFSGAGGIFPQSADYLKHNLLFHDLVHQSWPVRYADTSAGNHFLCYGLGYYLVPALGGKWLGESFLPGFTLAWTFGGVALFFYWAATFAYSPKKTLAIILFFAATGGLWMGFKNQIFPGGGGGNELAARLLKLGLWFGYNDSFTRFQYQPQHALAGWLGAAVLYEWIWVNKNPRGVFLVWTGCLLWSPLTSLGLLLVPVAAWRRVRWQQYFEPVNLVAGGGLFLILAVYFQAHCPLDETGPVWQFSRGAEWLWFYVVFIGCELSALLFIYLADKKYQILGELRPLWGGAVVILLGLPLYKLGFASDLRLEASAPALLFVALAVARCWLHPACSLKQPVFILLAVSVLLGAIYPVFRPWQNLLFNANDFTYTSIVRDYGFKNLAELRDPQFNAGAQYLGRSDTAADRWLLR